MKTNIKDTIKFLIIITVCLLICYSLSSCTVQRQPVYFETMPHTVYYYPHSYYYPVHPYNRHNPIYKPTPAHRHHIPVKPPKRGRR